MLQSKKIVLTILSLTTLIASIAMLCGIITNPLRTVPVHAAGVSSTDYYLSAGSDPWGTAFDSSGLVWVAAPGCDPSPMCGSSTPPGKIDVFNPTTSSWSNTYTLPSGYAQPLFLAIDAQGNAWFTQPMGNSIGMLNPSTKTFQQWTVPTASAGPWGIAIDSNGNIWFTEHYANKIGRFSPTTHTFTEISTPASNSQPYGITVDSSNNIWFTENNSSVALIGEYTAGGTLKEYRIRTGSTSGLTPHLITVDPNGNIWWSEGWVTAIGELVVSQAVPGTNRGVSEYFYQKTCTNCGSHTSGIRVDSNGQIWFDDSLQSIFGSFPDSGNGAFSIYNTPTSNSHPHDGLDVDSQNRIWLDEEFANKLAKAVQASGSISTPTVGTSPTPTQTTTPSPTPALSPTPSLTPGTTLAQDSFQRPNQKFWGTASDGYTWGSDASINSAFTITNNSGQIANGNASYNAILGAAATNAEVLFTGSISSFNGTNIGAVLRWTDGNDWYKAYIDGINLVIQKKVNGTTTILGTAAFPATGGTSYTLRFRVIGSTLYAKVWQTGTTEPSNWMLTPTDNSLSSGYCGLRMLDQNGAIITYTSFIATSQ